MYIFFIYVRKQSEVFYVGAAAVIAVIILVGVLSGRKMNSGAFSGEKSAGAAMVAGALIGTIVGGSSTIGTAQLAYTNGLSAWWYTLGGGIGFLLMGLVFVSPIYKKQDIKTIPDIISKEYGPLSGVLIAVFSSLGTFLSFVAQVLSGCALMMTVFGLSFNLSVGVMLLLIVAYVFFGGAQALGRAGIVKTVIIGVSVLVCGIFALFFADGLNVASNLELFPDEQYFNLFSRGVIKDGGAGMSLLLGVITTQSYVSAILMAKNVTHAKAGCFASAIIVPIMGVASIFVGLYMKANVTDPDFDTKLALPTFIMENMPPVVAGMMVAALLITVVGSGAGLTHGMSAMLYKNMVKPIADKKGKKLPEVAANRILLVIVALIGAAICFFNLGDLILEWSFLSMGLRAAVGFLPLIGALFLPGKIDRRCIIISMPAAVVCTILGEALLPSNVDPLFAGLGASLVIIIAGFIIRRRQVKGQPKADN